LFGIPGVAAAIIRAGIVVSLPTLLPLRLFGAFLTTRRILGVIPRGCISSSDIESPAPITARQQEEIQKSLEINFISDALYNACR
jgi:hypothetical protein